MSFMPYKIIRTFHRRKKKEFRIYRINYKIKRKNFNSWYKKNELNQRLNDNKINNTFISKTRENSK